MTRALVRFGVLGGLVTAAAVVLGGAPRARSADAYALFLGALLMAWLVHYAQRVGGGRGPSTYERSLRPPAPRVRSRPVSLARLERIVYLAAVSANDLHLRLRPRLRFVAEHRLESSRGLHVDSQEAQELLGDELAELVRTDRQKPEDPFAPGMPLERQRDALDRLERI
jgi:hypothetical protein